MEVLFVAAFSPIVTDMPASKRLYMETLAFLWKAITP